jgi:Opioid growth factor receptor (OGFr) conserved region
MLKFYGLVLQMVNHRWVVRKGTNWEARSPNWMNRNSHNHLRITRILICLRTLGLSEIAFAYYETLTTIYRSEGQGKITADTFEYWTQAISQ